MLINGDRALDLTLPGVPADRSADVEQYRLSDALGSKPVLLNFYFFDGELPHPTHSPQ